jgi:hypothetical protein
MTEQGNQLSDKAVEQLDKTVREVARRMMNERQRRGRWQWHGGGGGTHEVWATIDSVECDEYTSQIEYVMATPTYYTGGCNADAIPGIDSYGMIRVEEICEMFTAYYTAEQLVGKTIRATYMKPLTGDCVAKWLVDLVCGSPECA